MMLFVVFVVIGEIPCVLVLIEKYHIPHIKFQFTKWDIKLRFINKVIVGKRDRDRGVYEQIDCVFSIIINRESNDA